MRSRRFMPFLPIAGLSIAGLVACAVFQRKTLGEILVGLAAALLLVGWIRPTVLLSIEGFGRALAKLVGIILTWSLLTPLYLVVFTTGRALLSMFRRDPLQRELPSEEPTYWMARAPSDSGSHKRQF